MSTERPDSPPRADIVSEDITLPAAESSVISRTKEQYAAMSPDQKRDFWLAVSATIGGVALTTAAFVIEKRNQSSNLPTALRTLGYSLDYTDGYFAKRTATPESSGAGTELGMIADPLADKFNNTLNEIALVQNGHIRPSDLAIRAIRDAGITAARKFITNKSKGEIEVRANKFGKLNTVVRDGVNLFASTKIAARHPRTNRAIHTGANIYSVASGAYTTAQLFRAYRNKSS